MENIQGAALITGASSGIGKEIARVLAKKCHTLVLVARSADKLAALAKELMAEQLMAQKRLVVHTCPVDLAEPNSARQIFNFTKEQGIAITTLVNNAGVGLYGEHVFLNYSELNRMLHLNIIAISELCHLFGEMMKQRRKGWILNIASTSAYQPTPFIAAYGASKAFVLNFSEALTKEMQAYGVIVSCLSPGATDTAFFDKFDERTMQNRSFRQHHVNAKKVAEVAIKSLQKGKISKIFGVANYLLALSVRFAPRKMVASISKWFLQSPPQ